MDEIQSAPFMPPIPSGTKSIQLFLFGDQTIAFEKNLKELLHVKDNQILQSFLDKAGFQLRLEISDLPSYQQTWFPRFTTIIDLASKLDETVGSSVLKFALLSLCQLGYFIKYFSEGSRKYPLPESDYVLGLCTGSFAAAAISTSQTIFDLIPASVEAVLVAFRTALCSLDLRKDIEQSPSQHGRSWSVSVNLAESEAKASLREFCTNKNLPITRKPYLSSVTPTTVTISGPPSVLDDFFAEKPWKPHELPIDLPYHASHLFDSQSLDGIVKSFHDPVLDEYTSRFKTLSASTGRPICAGKFKDILNTVVADTLQHPLRWDRITEDISKEFASQKIKKCAIYSFFTNSAQSLSSRLTKVDGLEVGLVHGMVNNDASASRGATGKFEQSRIAIIGYSGRFPDAASNEEFWDLLRAGRDVHRTIPDDRFDWKAHFDASGKTKNTSRIQYGCFIKEPGLFDTRFFNMSPRESENTDPAQRLAITATYEAIEMAGLVPNTTPSTQQDRIGVFFGTTSDDWREVNSGQNVDTYFIPGGNRAFIPGRISYFFRFCGPSISLDTACSSSFAAIQTACAYLWRGECDTAVAGGTNVLTNPDNFAGLDRGHFLSTTGNCNAFDDGANGYCRADAVGSVILKRLEDAQTDNDPIFGVIVGAYTNHCGQTDSITRPHEGDQASVFRRIMRHAGVNPLDISYIEMHGTGTQAGDATEMNSVLSVFVPGFERMPQYPLYLGSAKANIGHAESASGVSSLIKVLMMMKHDEIPPHCGIKTKINHNYPVNLEERNVNIAFRPISWKRKDCISGKRTVFLNNFSAAGGNTAVLLEDAPSPAPLGLQPDTRTSFPVSISARSQKSLKGNIAALLDFLDRNPNIHLPSLSYTTTARRLQHNYRAMCNGSSIDSIKESLRKHLDMADIKPIPNTTRVPGVVFAFTGQGSVYYLMGRQLFDSTPSFQRDILRFDSIAQRQGFQSFLPIITDNGTPPPQSDIVVDHLALTCIQMALSRLWRSWGVSPVAVTGHSLGEYAAFETARILTASEVICLVGTRAQLLSRHCNRGTHAMLAVKAPLSVIEPLLSSSHCEVACINQPTSNVISGEITEIDQLMNIFQVSGNECVRLDLPYAFHSAQVDPILPAYEAICHDTNFHHSSMPYLSPLHGCVISKEIAIEKTYLSQASRRAVNFQRALEAAKAAKIVNEQTIWLEIGSHPICSGMIKGTLGSQSLTIASLRKATDSWKVITSGLETLHKAGVEIDWTEFHRDFRASLQVLALPCYRWELKNYWIQYRNNFCLTKGEEAGLRNNCSTTQVQEKLVPIYISPSVQRVLEEKHDHDCSTLLIESDIHDPRLAPAIQGHKVNGAALCPSSLYADIAMTMGDYMVRKMGSTAESTGLDVANMKVDKPLIASPTATSQLLRVSATADWARSVMKLSFFSINEDAKKIADHATCEVRVSNKLKWIEEWARNTYLIQSRISFLEKSVNDGRSHKMKRGIVYKLFSSLVEYGPHYQGMNEVVLDSQDLEATAKVTFKTENHGYYFNPSWIDSLGHIAGFIMNGNDNEQLQHQVYVNHGWDRMRCARNFSTDKAYQTYNRMQLIKGAKSAMYQGDTYIFDEDEIIAVFEGIKFQGVSRQVLDHLLPSKKGVGTKTLGRTESPVKLRTTGLATSQPVEKTKMARNSKKETSSNGVMSKVIAIICEEAGIQLADLTPSSEFAEYGVDSLLSLTISGRLQEELGLEVQSSLFSDYPTVRELSQLIAGGEENPSATMAATDDKDTMSSVHETDSGATSGSEYDTQATSADESTDLIETIRNIISAETGIAVSDISMNTSFAELGIDSLLALTITGKLSEDLELDISSTLLAENESLGEVGAALGLKLETHAPKMTPSVIKNELKTMDPNFAPHATSILLQGNPRAASKVLFLFPDGAGSATSYASLAKISPDIVVYGLNCPWMKIPESMTCTLEFLTEKYLIEIRRRQPRGPYYFGGWSAGGIVAYEAAQQLHRAGEKTGRLILIDSPNPIGLENPPQRMYDFFESLDFFGMNGKAPPSWLRPHFNSFLTLLDNYKIQPFGGPPLRSHIVYAKDGICKNPEDPRPEIRPDDPREMLWLLKDRTDFGGDGWASLVGKENLEISVLDGVNHFSMVAPGPKIQDLSNFVCRAMEN